MPSVAVLSSSVTTSGMSRTLRRTLVIYITNHLNSLLDKIAKDILVCENKTIQKWDGTIGEYKEHLRKKMISAGAV